MNIPHSLTGQFWIGEGLKYRPFHNLRSVPKAKGTGQNSRKGLYSGPFPM
jgi:hypothetical protein